MKKLVLFGVIILIIGVGAFSIQYANAGKGSGWPGHHRGCFIETVAGDEEVSGVVSQNDANEYLLAYRGGGYSGHSHSGYSHGGGHGGHHNHGCFTNTVSNSNWFERIFDFIWRPRS